MKRIRTNILFGIFFLASVSTVGLSQNTPDNLTSNIAWSPGNFNTVADIQAAFNNGRAGETTQLPGKPYYPFPTMTLPSQSAWDAMSNSQKALWLINDERAARNVLPLEGVDLNVISVAQTHANYLLTNNLFTHTGSGGTSPWQRLDAHPAINGHHDFLSVAENLSAFVTSGNSIPLPIERSVYGWIYEDASSAWGHRVACLFGPFTNNFGPVGSEGLMGIGRSSGGPWSGFGTPWNFAEIVVFNVFDPDGSYNPALPVQLSSFTGTVSGQNQVTLKWRTLSEINNFGFYIERRSESAPWGEVPNSFVAGHGTSNQTHDYSFVDGNLTSGTWFYRLRQVDLDGTNSWSEPVQVSLLTDVRSQKSPQHFSLSQNYPNPFNPATEISYQLPNDSHVSIKVFDFLGREVATLVDQLEKAGSKSIAFDASGLSSGTYFYRLQAGQFIDTKKLVLVR